MESIHPRKRYALLRNRDRTQLVRQLALEPRKEGRTVCHRVARSKDLTILRVAHRAILAPYSETVVLSNTGKRGPVLLEASDDIYRRKKVALANGVAQVKPDVAFPVRVANMSSKEAILQKHEKFGTAYHCQQQQMSTWSTIKWIRILIKIEEIQMAIWTTSR